jgi:hypothetical protein
MGGFKLSQETANRLLAGGCADSHAYGLSLSHDAMAGFQSFCFLRRRRRRGRFGHLRPQEFLQTYITTLPRNVPSGRSVRGEPVPVGIVPAERRHAKASRRTDSTGLTRVPPPIWNRMTSLIE